MEEPEIQRTATAPPDAGALEDLVLSLPERFKPQRLLGAGGQGWVWLATDSQLGERVAIKVLTRLSETTAERVRREVRLCRRLRHPHLAEVYELVEAGDRVAVVMEYLPGGSLASRLRSGPLAITETMAVGRALLAGLACLHEHGIIHRDVKPSNVLMAADGTPKLADFGTLRPLDTVEGLTFIGAAVGTPAYMSPEQVRAEELTPASDLYALGVTLYELLTGAVPFSAASDLALAQLQISQPVAPLRQQRHDCPRWLATFVERLLEKEPRRRFADAAEALDAFEHQKPGLSRGRRRALAAGTVSLAMCGVALAGVLTWRASQGLQAHAEGNTLVATTASGAHLWRKDLGCEDLRVAVGDVLAARGPEVVTLEGRDDQGLWSTEVVVRDRSGAELRREHVALGAISDQFMGLSDSFSPRGLAAADLDGDGRDEIVWAGAHPNWYPALAGVWRASSRSAPGPVLTNSGHIVAPAIADLDGDGAPELVVAGVNNILGYQAIVAILKLTAEGEEGFFAPARSPDLLDGNTAVNHINRTLHAYTVLGDGGSPAGIVALDHSGIVLRIGNEEIRLDPDGNPRGSPLFDKGAQHRQAFWLDRVAAGLEAALSPGRAGEIVDAFAVAHPLAWAEAPSRDAALMLFARDLADAGQPEVGARLLERAVHGSRTLRRVYRQAGEFYLLAGRRPEGRAMLLRAVASLDRGFGASDELAILRLEAAAAGDGKALAEAAALTGMVTKQGQQLFDDDLSAITAFLGADWETMTVGREAWESTMFPWRPLAHWAALETGQRPERVLETLVPACRRREAEELCLVVQARARMLLGDLPEAAHLARQALSGLRPQARRWYEPSLQEAMAHWVLGIALAESGQVNSAQAPLSVAAERLPGTWLGRDARQRLEALQRRAR